MGCRSGFYSRKSFSSVVFRGKRGKPGNDYNWPVLGYPPAGIAVPLWFKGGEKPLRLWKDS
jgi:hypothetical protein